MSELLGLSNSSSSAVGVNDSAMPAAAVMHAKLVKADLHGAIITGACTYQVHDQGNNLTGMLPI